MIRTPEQAQEMFQKAIKEWGDYVRMARDSLSTRLSCMGR